jgi:hypothetical protein
MSKSKKSKDILNITSREHDKVNNVDNPKTFNIKKNDCIKNNILSNEILLVKQIGTKSVDGIVYKACYPINCKKIIAVKRIMVKPKYINPKYINNYLNKDAVNDDHTTMWSELMFLTLSSELVKKHICPHLPLFFYSYFCKNCENENCIYILNELANGDLKAYLNNGVYTYDEVMSCYYQIYMALYTLKKRFGFQHNDLHWGNVLFHNLDDNNQSGIVIDKDKSKDSSLSTNASGSYVSEKSISKLKTSTSSSKNTTIKTPKELWKYKLKDNKTFTIPIYDKLFVLWDFGRSTIPNKVEPGPSLHNEWDQDGKGLQDFIRITQMLLVSKKDAISKEKAKIRTKVFAVLYGILKYVKKTNRSLDFFMEILPQIDQGKYHRFLDRVKVTHTFEPLKKYKSSSEYIESLKK